MHIISNFHDAQSQTIGTKAWNLFLLQKHFPVPEFVVISTNAFKEYRKNQKINSELEKELRKTLEDFLGKGPVAIRSSGTAEDLPGLSFAGMYVTTLNITNVEDAMKAITRTWDSTASERVKVYCQKMNVPMGEMAVIIQHQLKPEISGVMVTQSPFNINEVLIECCRGLGDKLVSGMIAPARYRIKGKTIVEQPDTPFLTESQLSELTEAGRKIENLFKSPQDIEWAIENGKLHILQSRPLLVYSSIPRRQCTVWCNVNVRETIPDPVSSLMWSLFDRFLFPMIILDAFGFPISRERFKKYPPVENISGRLYWNVNNTLAYGKPIGPLLDLMESDKNLDPQMRTAMKSVDIRKLPDILPSFTALIYGTVSLIRLAHYLIKSFFSRGVFKRKFNELNREFEEKVRRILLSDDITAGLNNIEKYIAIKSFARRYFGGIFLSLFYLIILQKLFNLRMGISGEALARKAVIGLIDKTGEMTIALEELANLAAKRKNKTKIELLKELYEQDTEFRNGFDRFIQDYGHRGPAEFDIASKTYRADPEIVFAMLEVPRLRKNRAQIRQQIIKELMQSLKPTERTLLRWFLPRLETYVPMREDGKHYYFKQQEKIREQFLIIDCDLRTKGFLKQERDIFFLSWDELKNIAQHKLTPSQTLSLVEARKEEWELFKKNPVPDIIYETGERVSAAIKPAKILQGEALSYGVVRAKARIIHDIKESNKLKNGEIMVTHHSDPGWTPLFNVASGVIVEVGGLICHAAMVARELGIPAVMLKGATTLIPDGALIELDADFGKITLI